MGREGCNLSPIFGGCLATSYVPMEIERPSIFSLRDGHAIGNSLEKS